MARLKDFSVFVEGRKNHDTWRPLQETETAESIKEGACSATRWTTAVEATPGFFRFVISCSKTDYDWGNSNGLRIVLSFDQGYQIKEYPVLVLRPGSENSELATKLNINIMEYCADDSQCRFYLDSIPLSMEYESSQPFYETQFMFKKLKTDHLTNLTPEAKYPADLAKLKVEVTPCRIFDSRCSRPIKPKTLGDEGDDRNKARKAAAKKGLTLETGLNWNLDQSCENTFAYGFKHNVKDKCTFVFLYREAGKYERLHDVDIIDYNAGTKVRSSVSLCHASKTHICQDDTDQGEIVSSEIKPADTPSRRARGSSRVRSDSNPRSVLSEPSSTSKTRTPPSPPPSDNYHDASNLRVFEETRLFDEEQSTFTFNPSKPSPFGRSSPIVKVLQNAERFRQETQEKYRKSLESLRTRKATSAQEIREASGKLDEARKVVASLTVTMHALQQEDKSIQQELKEAELVLQKDLCSDLQGDTLLESLLATARAYEHRCQQSLTGATENTSRSRKRKHNELSPASGFLHTNDLD